MTVTVSTLPPESYSPAAAAFANRYRARYHTSAVDPYAVAGYDAMRLVLDAVAAGARSRAAVLGWLHGVRDRAGLMGTYGFDADGDTTLRAYGTYGIAHRQLVFKRVVTG